MSMKSAWSFLSKVRKRLGTPAGADVSTDIAAVKAETVLIGTPTDTDIATDIVNVQTVVDTLQPKPQFKTVQLTEAGNTDIVDITGSGVLYGACFHEPAGGTQTVTITIDGVTHAAFNVPSTDSYLTMKIDPSTANSFFGATSTIGDVIGFPIFFKSSLLINVTTTGTASHSLVIYGEG